MAVSQYSSSISWPGFLFSPPCSFCFCLSIPHSLCTLQSTYSSPYPSHWHLFNTNGSSWEWRYHLLGNPVGWCVCVCVEGNGEVRGESWGNVREEWAEEEKTENAGLLRSTLTAIHNLSCSPSPLLHHESLLCNETDTRDEWLSYAL